MYVLFFVEKNSNSIRNGKRKFREGDKLKSSKSKPKICGVVNSRGKPCQRTGFCPFHHKLSGSKKTYSLRNSSSSEQLDDESYSEDESSVDVTRNSSSKIRLTNRKRDRVIIFSNFKLANHS